MKKQIIQFGMIRSGSTLIYNILKEIFPNYSVIKTHQYPSKWSLIKRTPLVCTFRDPLDIICSSIKRYEKTPNRITIDQQINELKIFGFDDFIKLEKKYNNKLNLRYKDFYNNQDFIFDKLENFFNIHISDKLRDEIKYKFSIKKVKEKISQLKNFEEMDNNTQFHGLHVSNTDGKTESFKNFFQDEDINYLKDIFKEFREKYIIDD